MKLLVRLITEENATYPIGYPYSVRSVEDDVKPDSDEVEMSRREIDDTRATLQPAFEAKQVAAREDRHYVLPTGLIFDRMSNAERALFESTATNSFRKTRLFLLALGEWEKGGIKSGGIKNDFETVFTVARTDELFKRPTDAEKAEWGLE